MTNRLLGLTGMLLAVSCAWAQDSSSDPAKRNTLTDRAITRRVDDLLQGSGTKMALDQDHPSGSVNFRTTTNKVYYHTSTKEKRLVRIEIEPVGEESPGSSKLAATFLTVLNAVESIDDGVKLAELLTKEIAKDGLTRSIALSNGVKFMKEKKGESSIRYIIVL